MLAVTYYTYHNHHEEITDEDGNKKTTTQQIPVKIDNQTKVTAWHYLDFLKREYATPLMSDAMTEWKLLNQADLVDNGTLEVQIDKLIEIRACCAKRNLKLDEYTFCFTVLSSLPDSYTLIKDLLLDNTAPGDLNIDLVRSKVIKKDRKSV